MSVNKSFFRVINLIQYISLLILLVLSFYSRTSIYCAIGAVTIWILMEINYLLDNKTQVWLNNDNINGYCHASKQQQGKTRTRFYNDFECE